MLKLAILGALGYAGYRYMEKNGGLPDRKALNDMVDTVKDKAGLPRSRTRT